MGNARRFGEVILQRLDTRFSESYNNVIKYAVY